MSPNADGEQQEDTSPEVIDLDDQNKQSDTDERLEEFESYVKSLYKEWKPYVGPEGGTGWTDGEDVVYDDEPPGRLAGLDEGEAFEAITETFEEGWKLRSELNRGEDILLNMGDEVVTTEFVTSYENDDGEEVVLFDVEGGDKHLDLTLEQANKAIVGQTKPRRDVYGRLVDAESFDPPETEQRIPEEAAVDLTGPFWSEEDQERFGQNEHPMWMSREKSKEIHEDAVDMLAEHYDDETVDEFRDKISIWQMEGYSSVSEMWIAAMSVLDTDKTPTPLLEKDGELQQDKVDEADSDVVDMFADMIRLSQNTAQDFFHDGDVEVYRQFSDSVIEKYAVETDDGFKINPQVLESWSVKQTKAESHVGDGGLVVEDTVSPEDVGIFGPIGLGTTNTKYAELTLMREETYEIEDDSVIFEKDEDNEDLMMLPLEETLFTDDRPDQAADESAESEKWRPFKSADKNGWTNGERVVYDVTPPGQIDIAYMQDEKVSELLKALTELPDGIVSSSDVENLFGAELTRKDGVEIDWVPYEGPRGGSGWQHVDDPDLVSYDDVPPGRMVTGEAAINELFPEKRDFVRAGANDVLDDNNMWRDEDMRRDVYTGVVAGFVKLAGIEEEDGDVRVPIADAVDTEGITDQDVQILAEQFAREYIDREGMEDPNVTTPESTLDVDEIQDVTTNERLENSFEYAHKRHGARYYGIDGGATTGNEMEILEYTDGSIDFATPVEAYESTRTDVVSGKAEAVRNNRDSPKVIDAFGGHACETEIVEDPSGLEYIVKEGLEGDVLAEDFSGADNESTIETISAAYFVGNTDLHYENVFVEQDGTLSVIDHDSAGEGDLVDIESAAEIGTGISRGVGPRELNYATYDKAHQYLQGEIDVPDDISDRHKDFIEKAVKRAVKEGSQEQNYMPPDIDVEDFGESYDDILEAAKELEAGDRVNLYSPEAGVQEGEIVEVDGLDVLVEYGDGEVYEWSNDDPLSQATEVAPVSVGGNIKPRSWEDIEEGQIITIEALRGVATGRVVDLDRDAGVVVIENDEEGIVDTTDLSDIVDIQPDVDESDIPDESPDEDVPVGDVLDDMINSAQKGESEWVPYTGPEGGQGWQSTDSGDVRYTEKPPGQIAEEYRHDDSDVDFDQVATEAKQNLSSMPDDSVGEQAIKQEVESAIEKIQNGNSEWLTFREGYQLSEVVSDDLGGDLREMADEIEQRERERLVESIDVGEEFDGFDVLAVGGAARDHYLGEQPEDIDLMAVPKPDEVDEPIEMLSEQMDFVDTESAFPVFFDSEEREVALPRTEESTGVGFEDFDADVVDPDLPVEEQIEIDMERRDMTIGSIGIDARDGELIDPMDGRDDVLDRKIEPVSEAFKEDPVRMLRAARFGPRLDFDIDDQIYEWGPDMRDGVEAVPDERVVKELDKTLYQADNPGRFFELLDDFELLDVALPAVDDNLDAVSESVNEVRERTDEEDVLYAAIGAGLGEDIDEFADSHSLSNDKVEAAAFGSRMAEKNQLDTDDLLDIAERISDNRIFGVERIIDLIVARSDGGEQLESELREGLGMAVDAVESIGGREVMESEGIDESDIGTEIGGEEFGELIDEYRTEQVGNFGIEKVVAGRALYSMMKASGDWVPYTGPEGGSGWRNTSTGTVDYSDEPPGDLDRDVLSDEQIEQITDYIGSEQASDLPVDVDVSNMENVDQEDVGMVVDALENAGIDPETMVNAGDYVMTLLDLMNQHYPRITNSTIRNLVTRLNDVMIHVDPEVLATAMDTATAMFLSQQEAKPISGPLFKDEETAEPEDDELTRKEESTWVPYEGPAGGSGWREVGEDNVEYQQKPPGAIDADMLTDTQIDQLREHFDVDIVESGESDSDDSGSSVEQIADPDWAEEKLGDEYNVDIDSVESGDLAVIGGRKEMIGEVSDGEIVTDPANSWDKPDTYTEFDGRLARSRNAGYVAKDAEQYLEFSDRVDVPDGWYTTGEGDRDDEGNQIIDIQNEEGEVFEIELTDPELAYDPFKFDKIEADHDNPWEEYDSDMPEDAGMEDIPIDLEDFGHEQLSDEQSGMVMNGLSKADDIGLIDDLDKLMGSDKMDAVAQYNPGMKVMTFNPDRFTQEEINEKRDNYYVAERPEEVALHESMHCKHAQVLVEEKGWSMEDIKEKLLKSRLDDVEREVIEEDVSEYGCANPLEIVAEIGTMIVKGEEVSDRAMALYQEYGGPEL